MTTAYKQYEQKNYPDALKYFSESLLLRPGHPSLIYNVAAMQALTGDVESALGGLTRIARMGLIYTPDGDSDFVSLWGNSRFRNIVDMFHHNAIPRGMSTVAFTMARRGLITEGIAFDSCTGSFYIGCVRTRTIIERTDKGTEKNFSSSSDGLWGMLGMKVDNARRTLWAVTSALPQMEGYASNLEGRSAVVRYDLQTGTLLKKYEAPGHHIFGDLTLDRNGNVYIIDSRSPELYRILLGKDSLELFYSSPEFVSLQGLTFSDDSRRLYVSDYARGIFVMDPDKPDARLMPFPSSATVLTIDGLYYYNGTLIASQNNVNPKRIVQIQLSSDEESCTQLIVLEANTVYCTEPTLGVLVGSNFYFIGSSGWNNVSDSGFIDPAEKLVPHVICKIQL